MRTALISDIHGNYAGLLAVIADIDGQGCDRVVCLGDLVDGGSQSLEVIQFIRERSIITVQGNHDEYPNTSLPWEAEAFLRQLPEALIEDSAVYTHTSPRLERKDKIINEIEAWNVFEEVAYRRIFVGDMHVPLIYGQRCSERVSAASYEIVYNEPFPFATDDRYIVCVGSIGYSRDGWNRLRYAIYDSERDTVHVPRPGRTDLSILIGSSYQQVKTVDEKQKQIIGECLNAAASGRFFPDWEFSTLFGLDCSEVAQIAADWPNIDFREDKVNRAINNSINNLLGYPIDHSEEWPDYISLSREELAIAISVPIQIV